MRSLVLDLVSHCPYAPHAYSRSVCHSTPPPRPENEEDRSLCIHETVTHWAAAGRARARGGCHPHRRRRRRAGTMRKHVSPGRGRGRRSVGRSEGNKSVMHLCIRVVRPVSRSSGRGRASECSFGRPPRSRFYLLCRRPHIRVAIMESKREAFPSRIRSERERAFSHLDCAAKINRREGRREGAEGRYRN